VSVPLILFFIPVPPPRPQKAAGTEQQARLSHWDRQAFAVLAAIPVLGGTTTTIISIHLLTLLRSQGLPLSTAVALGIWGTRAAGDASGRAFRTPSSTS